MQVLAYVCIGTIEWLRLCFNTVEVKKEDVVHLEELLNDNDSRHDGRKLLNEWLSKLRSASFVPEALTTSHLHLLSEAFEKHYPLDSRASYQIGSHAHGHTTFSSYRLDAANAVRQAVVDIEQNAQVVMTLNPDVLTAMRNAENKVRLVLMSKWHANYDFSDFPFFTRSFYAAIRRNLKMINRSLLEVSVKYSDILLCKD